MFVLVYHKFTCQYDMCCGFILFIHHNSYTIDIELCHFINTWLNVKSFGFSSFYAIPLIMKLAVMQLYGVYYDTFLNRLVPKHLYQG